MPEDSRDVLMKIVLQGGGAIPAECSAEVASDDPLAGGFSSASQSNHWKGNYFSVGEFQIELGLSGDSETGSEKISKAQKRQQEIQQTQNKMTNQRITQLEKVAGKLSPNGKPLMSSSDAGRYSRFMNQGRNALSRKSYSASMEPISFTKNMDASSVSLFRACMNSTTLESAVLIKRRGVGQYQLRTYLRIEFTDLLITDFGWDEDDVIKEKIKFICREVKVQYSKEQDNGALRKPDEGRKWSALTNMQS